MQWWGVRQNNGASGGCEALLRAVALRGGFTGVVVVLAALLSLQVLGCGSGVDEDARDVSTTVARTLDARSAFISTVLADVEDCWTDQFHSTGEIYNAPALVLFSGVAPKSSESGLVATGPFYSSTDRTIYLDLRFYGELQDEYGAIGDSAEAYVVAHEVGHAVQDQLGVLTRVETEAARASEEQRSRLLLRVELQADFYAGLAARYQGDPTWLRRGDIERAIAAASSLGHLQLSEQEEDRTVPDSFTHGTLAQRVRWFMLGYETGDLERGDTFSVSFDGL